MVPQGRDLNRTIIVDNSPASYILHPEVPQRHLFDQGLSVGISGRAAQLPRIRHTPPGGVRPTVKVLTSGQTIWPVVDFALALSNTRRTRCLAGGGERGD